MSIYFSGLRPFCPLELENRERMMTIYGGTDEQAGYATKFLIGHTSRNVVN